MAAPIRFLTGRQQQQKIGVIGSTEDTKVLEVIGRVGIGTTIFDSTTELDIRGNTHISGRLGIGITNPTSTLHLSGIGSTDPSFSDEGNRIRIGDYHWDDTYTTIHAKKISAEWWLEQNSPDEDGVDLVFYKSRGIPNAEEPVQVGDNLLRLTARAFKPNATGSGTTITLSDYSGDFAGQIVFDVDTIDGNNVASLIDLRTADQSRLIVKGDGKVGIGTTNPIADLDVVGLTELDNLNVSGIATVGTFGVSGLTTTNKLKVVGLSTFESNVDINASVDISNNLTVDGLSDLDELNVAGIATFRNNVEFFGPSSVQLTWDSVEDILKFKDDVAAYFGDGDDLRIFHNGSDSYISDGGVGNLNIISNGLGVSIKKSGTEPIANFNTDGSVELYYDNSKKFETTGIGVSIVNGTSDTATIYGPSNLIIDPMPVGVGTTSGIVRIKGDLYVDGTQFVVSSSTIELADFVVGIATTAGTDLLADGAGIQIGPDNTFLYEYNSGINPSLKSSENLNVSSGKVYQIAEIERLSADTLSLGTGTTIHSPSNNVLTLGTNNLERIRISDNVDINVPINVDGHTELDDINVSGVSTFASNVDINASIDVDGHTELDNLNVSGVSTFASNVDINAGLDVDGFTELDATNISETLNVVGLTTFSSNVDINADLDVDGRVELDTTNISETLNVVGVSTFGSNVDINADLDVDGHTELDNLNVSGVSTFASNVDINADLDVDGHTELDNLNVSGVSTFASNVDINAGLDVDGRTELDTTNISETLNVSGVSTFLSDIDINASIDVDGHTELDDLNVSGVSTFSSNLDINASVDISSGLNVSGISTFASDLDINASIDVDGHTELDDLNVSGVSTFIGIGTFQSDLYVGGDLYVADDLIFDEFTARNATLTENLQVSGISTFNGSVDINSSIDVDGHTELDNLNVSGVSTFASNVDINAGLDVDGKTELDTINISETLNVVGVSTFGSNIDINASIDVDGHTELDNLNVSGVSTFASNVDINAGLDVDGRTELDTTNISETLSVSGLSTFLSDIDINASIDVDGHTELDNLNVSGVSTFASNVDINAGLDVDGRTELDNLNVSGVSTFASNVDINASIDVDGHTELDTLNVSVASTIASLTLSNSGIAVTAILDEDLFTSNRADALATQQSIKAYVDAQVTAQDLDIQGDTGGALSIDLDTETLTIAGTANEIETSGSGNTITIGLPNDVTISNDLTVSGGLNVTGVSTFQSDIHLGDNDRIYLGTSDDLEIFHNGHGVIRDNGTGNLYLQSNGTGVYIQKYDGGGTNDNLARFITDGAVELYYDNSPKFETTGYGVTVSGSAYISGIATITTIDATNATIDNLTFTSGTAITSVDTDLASVSGSDDTLASAKAIKTYVDSQVTAQDLDFAGDTGTGAVDLDTQSFSIFGTTNEIETVGSGQSITIGLPNVVAITTSLTVGDATGITGGAPTDEGVLAVYTSGGKNALIIQTDSNTDSRGVAFRNSGDAYIGYISMENVGSNLGDMAFGVSNDTETSVSDVDERVRFTKDGDVGIGSVSPTEKLDVAGNIAINQTTVFGSATASLSTVTETAIHTGLSTSTYRSVEYNIQATEGTNFHVTKILALHNGTTAYHNEYGTIYNNTSVATFNVDVSGGNIRLLATGASASQTDYVVNFTATKI